MANEGILIYLKDYENCLNACGLDKSASDDEKAGCIHQMRTEYGAHLCKVEEVCPIVGTPKYIRLLLIFKEVLRFIYTSRVKYGNKLDSSLILMISSIPLDELGITLEELSCIKFPGDGSLVPNFPKTLSEYLGVLNDLMKQEDIEGVNVEGWVTGLSPKRQNMSTFFTDFQPWARSLSTFLRKNSLEIPEIEKPDRYGAFTSGEYLSFMEDLQSQGLLKKVDVIISIDALRKGHKQVIRYLMTKIPAMGGSKRSKRKTRNKRKSKTVKKRK